VTEIAVVDIGLPPRAVLAEFARPIGRRFLCFFSLASINIVHNGVLFPAVVVIRGSSAGDRHVSREAAGFPAGQGGAPQAETKKRPTAKVGL